MEGRSQPVGGALQKRGGELSLGEWGGPRREGVQGGRSPSRAHQECSLSTTGQVPASQSGFDLTGALEDSACWDPCFTHT